MESLPTKKDFGIEGDLDVDYAWKNFGGKSLHDACLIFATHPLHYYEDFMHMAPSAFLFYFPAAIHYLMSEEAKGDSDAVSCIANLLNFRFEQEGPEKSAGLFDQIKMLCDYVIANYDRFEADFEIYGDVKAKYEEIKKRIGQATATG